MESRRSERKSKPVCRSTVRSRSTITYTVSKAFGPSNSTVAALLEASCVSVSLIVLTFSLLSLLRASEKGLAVPLAARDRGTEDRTAEEAKAFARVPSLDLRFAELPSPHPRVFHRSDLRPSHGFSVVFQLAPRSRPHPCPITPLWVCHRAPQACG